MFQDENKEKEFSFMHCFTKIQTCEKWKQARLTLNAKPGVEGDDATPASGGISAGRPAGRQQKSQGDEEGRVGHGGIIGGGG
jgi:hypothetical protein